jgi:hypothetical protein
LRRSDTADRLRAVYASAEQRFRRDLRAFLTDAR